MLHERKGRGGNEFGGDWGRRDFEEFVVAKVEQPA